MKKTLLIATSISGLIGCQHALGQSAVEVNRPTELRSDKLPAATVLAPIPRGSQVRLLNLEGGWAWIEANRQTGWVRASTLNTTAHDTLSSMASGRQGTSNEAVAMTVRSMPPRANRHALIISISQYADSGVSPLPGANVDRESATQIAAALQIPKDNISYLTDAEATGDNIRQAVGQLNSRVREGDQVFLYFSGHGTRYFDPHFKECTEALAAYDGVWKGTVTHQEMAQLLNPISSKADKLFVMYDSCYSGGMLRNTATPTRGHRNQNDEGVLRGRFAEGDPQCSLASNVRTRGLQALMQPQVSPNDYVLISASRNDELSLEDDKKGGLATQYIRDCLLRDAKDTDASGGITIGEVQTCAQQKIDRRMEGDRLYSAQHLTLSGNREYVANWSATAPQPSPPAPPVKDEKPGVAPTIPFVTGVSALQQIYNQRDTKRRVQVNLVTSKLRIGQDNLAFSVQSDRPGYVYAILAGSDNKSLNVLFPNKLDDNNRISADQQLMLPRPNWPIKAAGPIGKNYLLIMVTDTPRDITTLQASNNDAFAWTLNDANGRANLGKILAQGRGCTDKQNQKTLQGCSDAFGATLSVVEESR